MQDGLFQPRRLDSILLPLYIESILLEGALLRMHSVGVLAWWFRHRKALSLNYQAITNLLFFKFR